MCCLFTCCGWMVDLIQRLWTFTMSCCISSSVCCVLLSTSMSGIALGYNYSLAEYIDLKETNVSVYLKRGVFDDDIADDFDFRRSGHQPVAGHLASDNLMTAGPDFSMPMGSGRRLDNSLVESDDPHKYEGSLMRLTAHAPFPGTSTTILDEANEHVFDGQTFPPGSLNELKVIHNIINARKSANANDKTTKRSSNSNIEDRFRPHYPNGMNPSARRLFGPDGINLNALNPARFAVPGKDIAYPRNPELSVKKASYPDMESPVFEPPYPSPIPVELPPIRPTRLTTIGYPRKPTVTERKDPARERIDDNAIPPDKSMKAFKEKMLFDKFRAQSDIEKPKDGQRSESDDYDEDIKGLPVRRRRRDLTGNSSVKNTSIRAQKTASTTPHGNANFYFVPLFTERTGSNDEFSDRNSNDTFGANIQLNNTPEVETGQDYVIENTEKTTVTTYSSIIISKLVQNAKDPYETEMHITDNQEISITPQNIEHKHRKSTDENKVKDFDVTEKISLESNDFGVKASLRPYKNPSSIQENLKIIFTLST